MTSLTDSGLPDLAPWLGDVSLADFHDRFWGRVPLAQAATTSEVGKLLDWAALDRVLRCRPEVLVVARGQLLPGPPPTTLRALRARLTEGAGLCIRHAERHCAELARLASSFDAIGTPQVQLFVTPGGTHGFGWHYDDEDVFIAQTAGVKDYYFRANTVAAKERARPAMFSRFPREGSQLCTATLVAGDFLYLPARWWHMAVCREDSLSISIGVLRHPTRDA